MSADAVACSDTFLRWCVAHVLNECRKGKEVTSDDEWIKRANPKETYPSSPPRYQFVVPVTTEPVLANIDTGKIIVNQTQASSLHHATNKDIRGNGDGRDDSESIKVTRAGRKIKIKIRRSAMKIAEATARPKYCPIPRTHFKLSKTALPVGTPDHLEKAKAAFASSVSSSAQASCTSACNHLLKAEAQLGRRFSSPPQEYEISYFTTECL